jgi:rRNA-processing protein FCF1
MLKKLQQAIGDKVGLKKKARLFFDTNSLLLLGSKGIDVYAEANRLVMEPVESCVVDTTLTELKNIIEGLTGANGKDKFNAKLGYIFVKQKGLKVVRSSSEDRLVDDTLARIADEHTYVVTLDKGLQKRLKEKRAKIITVRQNRLELKQ